MSTTTLGQLAEKLAATLDGDADRPVDALASLDEAGPRDASFLANPSYRSKMSATSAAAVIVAADYDGPVAEGLGLLRCEDPYFAFREAMVLLHGYRQPEFAGIDETARIHPSATLGEGCRVGPFVSVGPNATLGARCVLYPGVYVGPGARVGDDCTLHPNVVVYDGCVLGDRVTLHANCSIGHDGFGYATYQGAHHKIPQAGRVEIGDDVELGAGCAVDRAALGATTIGAGTKFSNLVTIGHGTKLGQHCLLVAQTGIAGSVTVGNYCAFGGQAGVAGHLDIGDMVRVGGQAGVIGPVPSNTEVMGMPARDRARIRRIWAVTDRLPELRDQVRDLTRKVAQLEARLGGTDSAGPGAPDA